MEKSIHTTIKSALSVVEKYLRNILQATKTDSESTRLLVSFCNISPGDRSLGIFDFSGDNLQWIDLETNMAIRGITGLAMHNGRFWFVSQESSPGLYGLNRDLKVDRAFHLSKTSEAHSLIPIKDGFLITDTGKNRINRITLSNDEKQIQETEFWKYNADFSDTVHLNSIACVNGKNFVSLFGQKPEDG